MSDPLHTNGLSPEDLHGLLEHAASGPTGATFDQVFGRAQRSRRHRWTAAAAAVVALVGVAIAVPIALANGRTSPDVQAGPPPTSTVPGPDKATPGAALRLVNRWVVHAPGVTGEQLVLGDSIDGGLVLYTPCGQLDGNWLADREGNFLARVFGGDQACYHTALNRGVDPNSVPWLDPARTFTLTDDGVELNDVAGKVLARLTPSHRLPPHSPNASDGFRVAKLTPSLRATLDAAAPALPVGVAPVTASSILGWWKPLQANVSPDAFLQFQPDRIAAGSDGCNSAGGQYAVTDAGSMLTISGPSTDVGCAIARVADEFSEIRRAGLDADGDLVVVDQKGKVLGKLVRVATGQLYGTFQMVGGPAPAGYGPPLATPVSGTINARSGSGLQTVWTVAHDGHFEVDLPPGDWSFTGRTPQYVIGDNPGTCSSRGGIHVVVGRRVGVAVDCQRR